MNRKATLLPFLLLLTFSGFKTTFGASLVRENGKGLLTLTYYFYTSKYYYDDNRNKTRVPQFYKNELNLYLEYGLPYKSMFTFQTSVAHLKQSGDTNIGVGDFEFGLTKELYRKNGNVLSVRGVGIVPGMYNRNEKPYLSLGKFGAELSLGTGIYRNSFYIDNQIGLRKYFGEANFIKDTLMIGIKPVSKWEYIAMFDIWYGLNGAPKGSFTISPKTRFVQFYNTFRYKWDKRTSFIFGFSINLYSENTGSGNHLYMGIWREF